MPWVEIHEEILGPKLRGLRKRLECSEATAIGLLAVLWLWASKNADENGILKNTDRSDIASAIRQYVGRADPNMLVDALVECGWIDEADGDVAIHDWAEWQHDALCMKGKREKDRLRKQRERADQKTEKEKKQQEKEEKKKQKAEKPPKPQKVQFAEAVTLFQSEYDKLVEQHGETFVKSCIEVLNNYKLSSGKKYASDYHAILNWVVGRVKEQKSKQQSTANKGCYSSIDEADFEKIMNPYGVM